MFNTCPACGEYSLEKEIARPGVAICPDCKFEIQFRQLPLFVVTGASGTGKSTLALALTPRLSSVVALEGDILWHHRYWSPESGFREFNEIYLRLAKNIGQAGRPVLLFRPCIPEQIEQCSERRYFAEIHYLAPVCEDHVLVERLKDRVTWRNTHSAEYVKQMLDFNGWLRARASDQLTLLDTGQHTLAETADITTKWLDERLP
jgi:hypothetical protein